MQRLIAKGQLGKFEGCNHSEATWPGGAVHGQVHGFAWSPKPQFLVHLARVGGVGSNLRKRWQHVARRPARLVKVSPCSLNMYVQEGGSDSMLWSWVSREEGRLFCWMEWTVSCTAFRVSQKYCHVLRGLFFEKGLIMDNSLHLYFYQFSLSQCQPNRIQLILLNIKYWLMKVIFMVKHKWCHIKNTV